MLKQLHIESRILKGSQRESNVGTLRSPIFDTLRVEYRNSTPCLFKYFIFPSGRVRTAISNKLNITLYDKEKNVSFFKM